MLTDKAKLNNTAAILSVTEAADDLYYLEFRPDINIEVKPGQFISILCDNLTLRRPFSVASQENAKLGVFFKKKGPGTGYISGLREHDSIDFIGPLGNGFNVENKKSLLIGAGVGFAPIFYLQTLLNKKGIENITTGAFAAKLQIPDVLKFDKYITDDGSKGLKGSVLDHLDDLIKEYKPEKIYSCGPEIVLKGICEAAEKYSVTAEIAMEKVMACSIGVCRGCVIQVKSGEEIKNVTICHDGPVFKGENVLWQ